MTNIDKNGSQTTHKNQNQAGRNMQANAQTTTAAHQTATGGRAERLVKVDESYLNVRNVNESNANVREQGKPSRLHALRTSLALFLGLVLTLAFANTAEAALNGYHDTGDCTSISGWAWDDTQPTTPISVDLYDGATLVTTVTAGNFRPDLLNAGMGDGNHGFQIATPASLINGQPHSITAKYAGTQTVLNNSPKTLSCIAPGQPTPQYIGFHDTADCTHLSGWAWDSANPGNTISVDLYDGATLVTTVTAGTFRQDLLNAGIGNGNHSFDLPLPASLINGQPHTITAKYAGTQTVLNNSPKTLSCVAPGQPTPQYIGFHDTADCTHLTGWAWDSANPANTISVDLYDGATLVATVPASTFRQDLLNAGIGNGNHSFDLPLPASLINGQPHSITAKYAGTQTVLNNSPKTLSCVAPGVATPAYNGYHDVADCTSITGWAWDANRPTTPISVDIYDGSTLLATVPAGTFRQDLLNAGMGDGNHSFTLPTPNTIKDGRTHLITIVYAGTQTVLNNSPKTINTCLAPVSVSLTSPANGASANAPGNFTLTAGTTGAVAKVDFYAASTVNGTTTNTLIGTATTGTNGIYSTTWNNVPAGNYTLTAIATDNLGNQTLSTAISVAVKSGVAQAYFIHSDHLDTPRTITDTAGNVVWQWDNTDPFGNNMPNENPSGVGQFSFPLRFAGQYADKETGLYYNVFRSYDPASGRYIESDPIGLRGGVNTYAYVASNPLRFNDPSGLSKHDPRSAYCTNLREKMSDIREGLEKRWAELDANDGLDGEGLPEYIGPGESFWQTRRGHRTLINIIERNLRDLEKKYDDDCTEPPSPPPVTNCPDENKDSESSPTDKLHSLFYSPVPEKDPLDDSSSKGNKSKGGVSSGVGGGAVSPGFVLP